MKDLGMNLSRRSLLLGCSAFGFATAARATPAPLGPLGLEIYSLRREMAKDIPGTLALIRQMEFEEVEVPGFYGLSAGAFREQLDRANLRCTAMVAQHDRLTSNSRGVIDDARVLGATYVIYPWIPHQDDEFTCEDCQRGAADMNRWGASLKLAGLEFCYHPHGYEFRPSPEGTLFDFLAAQTDPAIVNFQADVFWIAWPGEDPVALMRRYPTRFRLMHLKDLRNGSKGNLSGKAPEETSVPVGTGMLNFPAILAEAKRIGIKRYYIEDEAPEAASNIPISLGYLRSHGF
jgi:sugar phosphate isomerase/epimerase